MGTTSEKLTYLNNTKQLLKDKINNLGGDITDQTTFRQYANQLQNVYDNYPKTEYSEGSNITLENCNKGKLDIEKFEGDTSQDGEPTPTNPVNINVVTGEQEVTIRGKNIAKLDQTYNTNNTQITYSENVPSSIVGTKTQQVGQFLATFTGQIEKGKTYTIDGNATQCYVYAYSDNIDGTIINSIQNLPLPVTFTANYTGFCLFALYFRSLDTGTASIKNFQVEEGSSATTYEPYITPITKQLSLGNIELAKIGAYRDYIWTDRSTKKWYKRALIGKRTNIKASDFFYFSGNDNNKVYQWRTNANYFTNMKLSPDPFHIEGVAYSNYFLKKENVIDLNNYYFTIHGGGGLVINTPYKQTADFTNWMNSINLLIYYQLATPTDTEITDTTFIEQAEEIYNIMSLNGTTIIEINGNLPMIIKVRALKGE